MRNQERTITFLALALLMLGASVPGIVRGLQASIAQTLYYQAKYGAASNNIKGILSRCETAYNLYPYNYYFCIWAGEKAYYIAQGCDGNERESLLRAASYWCDVGLRLNFRKSQLRALRTRLLERYSLSQAILFWKCYVDWQFWEPSNHKMLVELYCKAGKLEEAADEIRWLKDTKYHEEAFRLLAEAWAREKMNPPEPRSGK